MLDSCQQVQYEHTVMCYTVRAVYHRNMIHVKFGLTKRASQMSCGRQKKRSVSLMVCAFT